MVVKKSWTAAEILETLEPLGSENYRKILRNHGIRGPLFGVKIEELKKFEKAIKKDYQLALDLFVTGVYDARYLAGLIADESKMTADDLRHWISESASTGVAEYAVAWVAAESAHGWELALEWIDSPDEEFAIVGWGTLSSIVSIKNDDVLDLQVLRKLLERVRTTIHSQPDRIRYKMNSFVIALGSYVVDLHTDAVKAGESISKVHVDMGKTDCKVPYSPDSIFKVVDKGRLGKKRKTARC